MELFEKGRDAARVRLEHAETGTRLEFELDGAAEGRMASGAVARARVGDVSATWTSYAHGLKEVLVLGARPIGNRIGFRLAQQGLSFQPDGQGGYLALDGEGAPRFHVRAPTVEDAQGRAGNATLRLDVGRGEATLELDPVFLAGAAYPLTVDPTIDYGTITIDGPSVTVTISQAGDMAEVRFDGTAGQYVGLAMTSVTISGSTCCRRISTS